MKYFNNLIWMTVFITALAVGVLAPSATYASHEPTQQELEEVQEQIDDLRVQILTLLKPRVDTAMRACPTVWTRNLSRGSTGTDVVDLQQFLNADPDTRVAFTGAGSIGLETQYYGPLTEGAVNKFQSKYSGEILAPLGLFAPTGFYGPYSRAKANTLCGVYSQLSGMIDDNL